MRNKKGFTLVELVIVIAVIAILAGVMIGTFASVVKKAQKSAEQQEMAAAKQEQTANDILAKLNNSNWLGWEDFETSLAEKIGEQIEESRTAGVETIQIALQKAVEEFAKKANEGNTGLTEAQVQYIVENALAKNGTGVTEAQVRSIINSAVSSIATGATKAQIQAIVDAAQAKNLTAADVAAAIKNAGLLTSEDLKNLTTKEDLEALEAKIEVLTKNSEDYKKAVEAYNEAVEANRKAAEEAIAKLQAAIEALDKKASTLTEKDVENILKKLMPVTETVTTADEFAKAVENLNSGSTIVVGAKDLTLKLETTEKKTLTIKGEKISSLTIDAPNATVYVYNEVTDLNVKAAALESVHVYGAVGTVSVAQGRVVFEATATITGEVKITSTATVEIEIATGVTVPTVTVKEGSVANVKIINNGTVAKLTNASTEVMVNVEDEKGSTTVDATSAGKVVTEKDWTVVTTAEGLKSSILSGEDVNVKLGADITADYGDFLYKNATSNVTINLNGHNIVIDAAKYTTTGKTAFVKLGAGKLELTGEGKIYVDNATKFTEFWTFYVQGSTDSDAKNYTTLVVGKDVTVEGTIPVEVNALDGQIDTGKIYGITVEINGTLIGKGNSENQSGVGIKVNYTLSRNTDESKAPQITLGSTSVVKSWAIGIHAAGYAVWHLSGSVVPAAPETEKDTIGVFNPVTIQAGTFYITGGYYYSNSERPTSVPVGMYRTNKTTGSAIAVIRDHNCFDGTTYFDKVEAYISGGTFVSENNYALMEGESYRTNNQSLTGYEENDVFLDKSWNWIADGDGVYNVKLEITGGTFVSNAGKEALKVYDNDVKESGITNNGIAAGYALDKKTGTVSKTK